METPTAIRLKEIGPWSEQYSSAGKRYYYNRETEVSQWDKPTEWKQAEREHAERAKTSTTGATKDTACDKGVSPSKHRHKQSTVGALASATSANKQVDSSSTTIPKKQLASSSPTVSSSASKRPRLEEDSTTTATRGMVSSSSASSHHHNKKSSTTGEHVVSSSSQQEQHQSPHHQQSRDQQQQQHRSSSTSAPHQQTPPSSTSATTPTKRNYIENSVKSSSNKKSGSSRTGSKSASRSALGTDAGQKRLLSTATTLAAADSPAATHLRQHSSSSHQSSSSPVKNDTKPAVNVNTSSPQKNGKSQDETLITSEGFREEKYTKFYRPELGSGRRIFVSEGYLNDLKKCSDRKAKQTNTLYAIDRDLNSIETLAKTAEFRTQLLKQRIGATTKRIQELEGPKGPVKLEI